MHISRPITLPDSDSAQRRSERGVIAAVILFTLVALGGSLWLGRNGAPLSCGGDFAAACAMP